MLDTVMMNAWVPGKSEDRQACSFQSTHPTDSVSNTYIGNAPKGVENLNFSTNTFWDVSYKHVSHF